MTDMIQCGMYTISDDKQQVTKFYLLSHRITKLVTFQLICRMQQPLCLHVACRRFSSSCTSIRVSNPNSRRDWTDEAYRWSFMLRIGRLCLQTTTRWPNRMLASPIHLCTSFWPINQMWCLNQRRWSLRLPSVCYLELSSLTVVTACCQ